MFQNLVSQMEDFEACAEPLQDCLNATERVVQESSIRLHDLTGKKLELQKLQVLRAHYRSARSTFHSHSHSYSSAAISLTIISRKI